MPDILHSFLCLCPPWRTIVQVPCHVSQGIFHPRPRFLYTRKDYSCSFTLSDTIHFSHACVTSSFSDIPVHVVCPEYEIIVALTSYSVHSLLQHALIRSKELLFSLLECIDRFCDHVGHKNNNKSLLFSWSQVLTSLFILLCHLNLIRSSCRTRQPSQLFRSHGWWNGCGHRFLGFLPEDLELDQDFSTNTRTTSSTFLVSPLFLRLLLLQWILETSMEKKPSQWIRISK